MNRSNIAKQKGMTLIELIIFMVVLSVGLTGVLTVIMTVTNSKLEPLSQWQGIQVGSNILDELLKKQYHSSADCSDLQNPRQEYLCEFQGINKQKLQSVFPEIAAQMTQAAKYDISIDLLPFYEEKLTRDVLAINITVSDPAFGEVRLSALKAARKENEKQAKRIHAY